MTSYLPFFDEDVAPVQLYEYGHFAPYNVARMVDHWKRVTVADVAMAFHVDCGKACTMLFEMSEETYWLDRSGGGPGESMYWHPRGYKP